MKTKIIMYLMAIVCFTITTAYSQELKELKIGDSIPKKLWNLPLQVVNHPGGKKSITLNEYRGKKLIILDFWAIWCKPCIAGLDIVAPIYKKYAEDIMLLPINSFDLEGSSKLSAEALMKKKDWNVPSVIDGNQFLYKNIFPPAVGHGIPHMIWIKDNKVVAIPKKKYVTEENIMKAINSEALVMEMDTTNHYPLDFNMPLFVGKNGATNLYYQNQPHAVIARYLEGYGTAYKTQFLQVGNTTILAAINRKLQDILFDAWQPWIFSKLDANSGIIWQISDSLRTRLFNGPKYDINQNEANVTALEEWNKVNLYGYNLRFPEMIREREALYFMQQDLSKFFGVYMNLHFKISSAVKHKFAVLKLLGTREQTTALLRHKGNKSGTQENNGTIFFNNHRFKEIFLYNIEHAISGLTIPEIIDSTGISHDFMVDFDLPRNIKNDTSQLNIWLKRYGLFVDIKEEFVPVLVVTEEKPNPAGK